MAINHQEVKLCLLGDSGVGKSSIVQRFVHDTFNPSLESTIGASFMTKSVTVDDYTFKFNIWDTAGQERYRALAPMYYRNAGTAIIVYDITSKATFQSVKGWIRELQLHGSSKIVLAITGNKCDLEDRREVSYKDAKSYADSIGAVFVETSARRSVNINELFTEIAVKIPRNVVPEAPKHSVQLNEAEVKRRRCC